MEKTNDPLATVINTIITSQTLQSIQALKLHMHREFNDEDKQKGKEIIEKLDKLRNKSMQKGNFHCLEEDIKDEPNTFLKEGVMLIVDGADLEWVINIMQNHILSGKHTNAELFEKLLILEGLFHLQSGTNPRLMKMSLNALLGVV